MPILRRMLPIIAAGTLLAGCGVSFSDPDQGNDFFESLEISGEHAAGAPLTAELAYETFYPVEVEISCEVYAGKRMIREIGRATVPSAGDGRDPEDEDDRVFGNFSFDFTLERMGSYEVECFTPCDEANFILEEVTLADARTPLPTSDVPPTATPSAEPTRRPCGLPSIVATPGP